MSNPTFEAWKPPPLPDPAWVRQVLKRHIAAARADVEDAAGQKHAGTLTNTFTLLNASWSIFHEPVYEGQEVAGYAVCVAQFVTGGYLQGHLDLAIDVLQEVGYDSAQRNNKGEVNASFRLAEPFKSVSY